MAVRKSTPKPNHVSPEHVARWLAARLRRHRCMNHDLVVNDVRSWFGARFSRRTRAGRLTFTDPVLTAFHSLTGNSVRYHAADGFWR